MRNDCGRKETSLVFITESMKEGRRRSWRELTILPLRDFPCSGWNPERFFLMRTGPGLSGFFYWGLNPSWMLVGLVVVVLIIADSDIYFKQIYILGYVDFNT